MERWAPPIALRRERGQTMTEFAIVVPIVLLLLFAIFQFGVVFHQYLSLTGATRAGARQAAVGRSVADPTGMTVSRVRTAAANLDQAKLGVAIASSWAQGADVTVRATYPYSVNLLGFVVHSGTLVAVTTERVE